MLLRAGGSPRLTSLAVIGKPEGLSGVPPQLFILVPVFRVTGFAGRIDRLDGCLQSLGISALFTLPRQLLELLAVLRRPVPPVLFRLMEVGHVEELGKELGLLLQPLELLLLLVLILVLLPDDLRKLAVQVIDVLHQHRERRHRLEAGLGWRLPGGGARRGPEGEPAQEHRHHEEQRNGEPELCHWIPFFKSHSEGVPLLGQRTAPSPPDPPEGAEALRYGPRRSWEPQCSAAAATVPAWLSAFKSDPVTAGGVSILGESDPETGPLEDPAEGTLHPDLDPRRDLPGEGFGVPGLNPENPILLLPVPLEAIDIGRQLPVPGIEGVE